MAKETSRVPERYDSLQNIVLVVPRTTSIRQHDNGTITFVLHGLTFSKKLTGQTNPIVPRRIAFASNAVTVAEQQAPDRCQHDAGRRRQRAADAAHHAGDHRTGMVDGDTSDDTDAERSSA